MTKANVRNASDGSSTTIYYPCGCKNKVIWDTIDGTFSVSYSNDMNLCDRHMKAFMEKKAMLPLESKVELK